MADWSTAYQNDLPDSSFAYIEPGGSKDADGKTTPRSLRHLPYKDADGKVDHNHTVNALARLNQTQAVPASERDAIRSKLMRALGTTHSLDTEATAKNILSAVNISPDANGNLPTRFPLLSTFDLPKSNRGHFKITLSDLNEIKEKFDAGIFFPSSDMSTGLPIDLDHSPEKFGRTEAAGWIHGLDVVPDPDNVNQGTMFADNVEWTDLGVTAVQNGRYKMVSPSGAFGTLDGKFIAYPLHTDGSIKLPNVLMRAGLTNSPFQNMMKPVRMDADGNNLQNDNANVIYVYDVEQKKESPMNLDTLSVKEPKDLSGEEYHFMAEHKSELSKDVQKKFGLEVEEQAGDQLSVEDRATLDAIKSGSKKVVDASTQTQEQERLSRMEGTVERYRKQEIKDTLDKHVKRGAIKQDQAGEDGFWGKQLLNAKSDDEMQTVKDALEALPGNTQLAQEIGTGEDTKAGSTAREQLDVLARKKVEAATKKGETLLYADALKQVYRENEELRQQDVLDNKAKASVMTAAGVGA